VTGTGNTELLVCSLIGASGAAFFNQPINLSMCAKWQAEFDFRLFNATGADGLAFRFLDVPPAGFVTGGGLGIRATANGLKICFDTWNNCIPFDTGTVHLDMPKIEIRWGTGYGECISLPTRDNSDGSISSISSTNYNNTKITYDNGNIQDFVNDSLYVTGYQQFNFTGYLGFTATTGGYTDNHSIKNIVIYTVMPPSFAGNAISFCPHDTVQLGGPSNPSYSYAWTPSGVPAMSLLQSHYCICPTFPAHPFCKPIMLELPSATSLVVLPLIVSRSEFIQILSFRTKSFKVNTPNGR
jgi:hypothetical protein